MKKEHSQHITSSFIDFEGKEHYFVIVAVSEVLPTKAKELLNEHDYTGTGITPEDSIYFEVNSYLEDYGTWDYYGPVTKVLKLGYAICNPEDEFNENVGIAKAYHRAKSSKPVMFVTNQGIINTTMVEGLLKQEANYLSENPEKYITGYGQAKQKFLTKQKMENMLHSFSEVENKVLAELIKDPNAFNRVINYYSWQVGNI